MILDNDLLLIIQDKKYKIRTVNSIIANFCGLTFPHVFNSLYSLDILVSILKTAASEDLRYHIHKTANGELLSFILYSPNGPLALQYLRIASWMWLGVIHFKCSPPD